MPHITANALSLYYERAGSGAPLLYISGTGGDLRAKPNMFGRGLPKAFDLIAYGSKAAIYSAHRIAARRQRLSNF